MATCRVVCGIKNSLFRYRVELLEGDELSVLDSSSRGADHTQLLSPPQEFVE